MKNCPFNGFAECRGESCQLWSEDQCRNQNTGASIDQIAGNSDYLQYITDTLVDMQETQERMVEALIMIAQNVG